MRKVEVALIGGSGLENLLKGEEQIRVGTPYGLAPLISVGNVDGKSVAFLPRHGLHHSVPPHKVNYHANVYAFHKLGAERVIATNAVGAINRRFKVGDFAVPHDFIDFTRLRQPTYYNDEVIHIDVSQPYCPEMRSVLIEKAEKFGVKISAKAVLVCTEGPRYETPAEIEMFRRLGCDMVGMTGIPEAVLARELEMCYATLCFVTNMAAGIQKRLAAEEVATTARDKAPPIQQILRETIKHLPAKRRCPCAHALRDAKLRD
ncbi:MAG: S-methyl-5'-thioadenosine phosphorylase [Candidatus Bathyarchaeota archaeon]|nr:S-methyl-5'-thioadenosine phosphorylase [Candidatus Bathyarchaeota archaeon]